MKQTKTLAKEYGFTYNGIPQESDFFEYIFESKMNGQMQQARKLFFDLNKTGKSDFFKYCLQFQDATESLELICDIFAQ